MKQIELTHGNHNIVLVPQDTGKIHMARIYCNTCQVYLNWASKDMYRYWCKQNYKSMELSHFYQDFERNGDKTPKPEILYIPKNEKLVWLDVSYTEKDNAKSHGARWSPSHKSWYTHTGNNDLEKLMRYARVEDMADIYEHINNKGNDNPYYTK
jgi:hypothetical protein